MITFVCYGTWLPGQAGAVDRGHNLFGSRFVEPNPLTEAKAQARMPQPPYRLDAKRRQVVLGAIQSPGQVLKAFKAYASRALNQTGLENSKRRRWARHGSTRYLWTTEAISAAVHYVVCEQGQPMEVLEMPAAH